MCYTLSVFCGSNFVTLKEFPNVRQDVIVSVPVLALLKVVYGTNPLCSVHHIVCEGIASRLLMKTP